MDQTSQNSSPNGDRQPGASRDAIRAHYDLSEDFFRLWLGPELVYSAALFEGDEDLATAQMRKLDHHIDAAHARGARRVLDIGCGWGALLRRLVQTAGVGDAIGLTLSASQAEWIRRTPVPGITVREESWREHRPDTPYDAIISIGAFEHFAHIDQNREERVRSYRAFFTHCRDLLRPRGMMSLQTTVYETMDRLDPFITSRIWPESQLPRLLEMIEASDHIFEVVKIDNHASHYERALIEWADRLAANREAAIAASSTQVFEDYLRYLKMSAKAYRVRGFSLQRLALRALPAM